MSKLFKTRSKAIMITALLLISTIAGLYVYSGDSGGIIGQAQPSVSSNNVTFTTGWFGTFIDTLNPFTSYSQLTNWINMNIYLPLVYYNTANHTISPGLASSWDVNYTNHTVIFHLNPNAVWSDGQPVTSQDVVYTYQVATQNTTFVYSETTPIKNATQDVIALGNHTVMIKFTGVLWTMFAANVFIVPQHVWKNTDPTTYSGYNPNGTYFVGDGPFVLTKYVVNQYVSLEKNSKFFIPSQTPKINKVVFQEFTSQSSAISALQNGQIQGLSRILPANLGQFQNNSNYKVAVSPNLEYLYLSFNVDPNGSGNPTLHNLTVRQAIAHAINLTYIAQTVYHGYATPLASVLAPTNEFYDHNLSAYSYNVSLANKMLNDSGFKLVNGVRENSNGTKLSYTVLVPSGDQQAVQMAQLIAQNMSAIGIQMNVLAESTGSMASTIWLANGTLGQDIDLWDWFDNIQSAPQLLSVFLSDQIVTGTSDSGFTNSTFDSLWTQLLNASTPASALAISNQMQAILHQQLPYLPLVVPEAINVWSSSFTDINSSMPGGPFGGGDWQTFVNMVPVANNSNSSGIPITWYIAGGVVAVIVIAAIAVAVVRSRGREE